MTNPFMPVELVTVPRYWVVSLVQLRLIAEGLSHEAALDQARAEVSRMMERSKPEPTPLAAESSINWSFDKSVLP